MAADDKKNPAQDEGFKKMLAEGIAEGVKQAVIALESAKTAAAAKVDKDAEQERKDNEAVKLAQRSACPHCHQPKRACGFKETTLPDGTVTNNDSEVHERIVVRYDNEDIADYFTGPVINGVTYYSSSAREAVCVPRNTQIRALVRNAERQELDTRLAKNKMPKHARPVALSA